VSRVPLQRSDLLESLAEQMGFLRSSASRFDEGDAPEFKRIATVLRVLLHHQGQSKALLVQLDILDRLRLLDSAGETPKSNLLKAQNNLAVHLITWGGDGVPTVGDYIARCNVPGGGAPRQRVPPQVQVRMLIAGEKPHRTPGGHLTFPEWSSEVVVSDGEGNAFSRMDLVQSVANTDGGAHVDAGLPEDYHARCGSRCRRR
jgi:hypothetical protein